MIKKFFEPHSSIIFARWILGNSASNAICPLKLQKLAFYCYAAATSRDMEDELGDITFEAWKYGPVVVKIYDKYKIHGSGAIPITEKEKKIKYSEKLTKLMKATLVIYERISPSNLVRQTHLEDPWIETFNKGNSAISNDLMKSYFKVRFAENEIRIPEMLSDSGFFEIDNLPIKKFKNLESLASSFAM